MKNTERKFLRKVSLNSISPREKGHSKTSMELGLRSVVNVSPLTVIQVPRGAFSLTFKRNTVKQGQGF